jgi:hypothetical protein
MVITVGRANLMSKSHQRGRASKTARKASPMRIFYALIGVIVVAGVVVLSVFMTQNQQRTVLTATPVGEVPAAPSGPTGNTAEGYAYKGNADATVVVTEYSDFQ